MSTLATSIFAAVMGLNMTFSPVAFQVSANGWYPESGDRIAVDTLSNLGYLIHRDGRYVQFPVATGQRKWVYYIGRSYNASTPNRDWDAKTYHVKGDRWTFGETGEFLRLYNNDGNTHTAYGFHAFGQEKQMFEDKDGNLLPADQRFASMGCIILRQDMMNLVLDTWRNNGEILEVKTIHGIENIQEVMLAFEKDQIETVAVK